MPPTPLPIDPRLAAPVYPAWAVGVTVIGVASLLMPGCGKAGGSFSRQVAVGEMLQLLAHYVQSSGRSDLGLAAIMLGILAGGLLMVATPFLAALRLRRPAGRGWHGVDCVLFSPWALFLKMGGSLLWGRYLSALTFTAQWVVLTRAAADGRRFALPSPPPSPTVAAGGPPS